MLVLDATDDRWLGRWNRLFNAYDISHLRSPMLWHVDPLDRDSLLGYTYAEERERELVEIRNCVGKEISKHAQKKKAGSRVCGKRQEARVAINLRERNDYFTPSKSLFCDHCQLVAKRYELESTILRQETLGDIEYGVVREISVDDEKLFTVTTNSTRRYAKAVVLAVGPANVAEIPRLPSMTEKGDLASTRQVCHSMHIQSFPDPVVQARMDAGRTSNILVVGGGLTSAQLSDLAIRRGVTKVWHLMRSRCRVKHFDVDLQWMGKYKNAEQARFWSADSDDERLEIIKKARGGGSITPLFQKRLKKHVASGRLELREQTRLADAKFMEEEGIGAWAVTTDPPVEGLPLFDFIYFATGIQTDFSSLPYLRKMMDKYPIQGHGGLPCLNEDLMWADGVPLFLVGRLASLRLGPAAPNIGGAKLGAERVAWAVEELVSQSKQACDPEGEGEGITTYLSGHGNMFSALAACE
ncbi:l-lysine 6-monooxygenase (NADPH-requiring) domain-containing protein [Hirsutella rhossiliensis]|uniref:L-ornithine N(5)-monooxygenase [NAD(P)H] n=1 Tax=Hirsutella rhossiliensis TaxID=111463 RepID=A0A9P8SGD9_9HYPO|nr:l-lysine 6-monooxygenase (NADPH-requiring) domain-containing protein [Hirsutella rhossiliensis]KAH0961681.1 l-lysine 6-monooxygenase (NADPH-requiring) domain-containing protein [Hirsutella rhossiliensis]